MFQRQLPRGGALKNFTRGKDLCQSFFFNKIAGWRPESFKKTSNIGIFCYILRNFPEQISRTTSANDSFWYCNTSWEY